MPVKSLVVVFFVFLGMGMPIYLVLGATAGVLFLVEGQSLIGIAQKMLDEMNSTTLLAVPFFVMAAAFMQHGGIAKALVDVAAAWIGWVRGGLGVVCVAACAMFAAICGSSVATALAMGTILIPAMIERKYPQTFALGVTAASGTLGILIPPSLPLILYAIITDQSVPRLFLAGVIPGLLQATLFVGWVMYYGRRHNLAREPVRPPRDFVAVNLRALPALSLPVIIAVGIYGGELTGWGVTATEAAAFAAFVALLVSLFFYRGFRPSQTLSVIGDSIRSAGTIIIIIACALAFGHWITESGVPAALVKFIRDNELSAWQFLLAINVMLLILGMFLEVASILLIALPIIYPVLQPLGIDPVHFAIVITVNMELALITAPVGLNLYVLSSVSKTPIGVVIRGVNPFLLLMLALLMLITYVPEISLWLPNLVYG
jgi:C4-dicarboxylate transporter DctM subunit